MTRGFDELLATSFRQRHSGDAEAAARTVGQTLGLLGQRIGVDYTAAIKEAIVDSSTCDRESAAKVRSEVASLTMALDNRALDPEAWLAVRGLLITHGFLQASAAARTNARELVLQHLKQERGTGNPLLLIKGAQAALDAGNIRQVQDLQTQIDRISEAREYSRIMGSYLKMCAGKNPGYEAFTVAPKGFTRLVSGRSVAVVGPSRSVEDQGQEIDGFDVVVRVNYWGVGRSAVGAGLGTRTDISYYNRAQGEDLMECDRGFLSDLKYAVFKFAERHACGSPSRRAAALSPVFFAGHPNMIPIIIFDLLHFRPARLKVFGTNFFLSELSHHGEYVGYSGARPSKRLSSFASHDLLGQLNVVRGMCGGGFLEPDDQCSRVLEMTDQEYLTAMEISTAASRTAARELRRTRRLITARVPCRSAW